MAHVVQALPLRTRFRFGEQCDAHEAARVLLDTDGAVHENCDPATCLAARFRDVFLVNLQNELLCTMPSCAFESRPPPDTTLDVALSVRPADLQDLLDQYQAEEFLTDDDDYKCQRCNGLVQKRLRVAPAGRAIMFQLKRFEFGQGRSGQGQKLHDKVSFPHFLPINGELFEFAAVITHAGQSANSGHYVACVNSGQLCVCDDARVYRTDWLHVAEQQAHMLV